MQCASVYLSKLLFYMQCMSPPPLPLPGPADLFQNAQHPWSSAHLPPRVELHLCSASPPQWTPCVWWVGVSGILACVLQSGDVYSHDLPLSLFPVPSPSSSHSLPPSLHLPFSSPLPPPQVHGSMCYCPVTRRSLGKTRGRSLPLSLRVSQRLACVG